MTILMALLKAPYFIKKEAHHYRNQILMAMDLLNWTVGSVRLVVPDALCLVGDLPFLTGTCFRPSSCRLCPMLDLSPHLVIFASPRQNLLSPVRLQISPSPIARRPPQHHSCQRMFGMLCGHVNPTWRSCRQTSSPCLVEGALTPPTSIPR